MKKLILLVLIAGCSVKIKGIPNQTNNKVGPDFIAAATFCDERYGYLTSESEACFADYRHYFDIKVSFDLNSITEFCNNSYIVSNDIDDCMKDLTEILTKTIK